MIKTRATGRMEPLPAGTADLELVPAGVAGAKGLGLGLGLRIEEAGPSEL